MQWVDCSAGITFTGDPAKGVTLASAACFYPLGPAFALGAFTAHHDGVFFRAGDWIQRLDLPTGTVAAVQRVSGTGTVLAASDRFLALGGPSVDIWHRGDEPEDHAGEGMVDCLPMRPPAVQLVFMPVTADGEERLLVLNGSLRILRITRGGGARYYVRELPPSKKVYMRPYGLSPCGRLACVSNYSGLGVVAVGADGAFGQPRSIPGSGEVTQVTWDSTSSLLACVEHTGGCVFHAAKGRRVYSLPIEQPQAVACVTLAGQDALVFAAVHTIRVVAVPPDRADWRRPPQCVQLSRGDVPKRVASSGIAAVRTADGVGFCVVARRGPADGGDHGLLRFLLCPCGWSEAAHARYPRAVRRVVRLLFACAALSRLPLLPELVLVVLAHAPLATLVSAPPSPLP